MPLPAASAPATPAAQPGPARRSGPLIGGIAVAVIALAVAALLLSERLMEMELVSELFDRGGSAVTPAAPTPVAAPAAARQETVTVAGMTLSRPAGWAVLQQGEQGLVLAARQEDITTERVQGPRFRLQVAAGTRPGMDAVVQSVLPAGTSPATVASAVSVAEEPRSVQVGGLEAVAVGLQQESGGRALITRYVVVNAGGGRVYQFLLEAPADQWGQHLPTLEGVLQSASFAAVPAPTQAPTVVRQQKFDSPPPASPDPSRITLALAGNEWDVAFLSSAAYSFNLNVADWNDRYEMTAQGRIMEGPPSAALGIRLRLASDPTAHHVTLVVEDSGDYFVTTGTGSGDSFVVPRAKQTLLRPKGELNTFVMRVNKPKVDVSLNGQPLTTFELPGGATARAGIFAQAAGPARVRFTSEQATPLP